MSQAEQRLREDRAMRDAARAVLIADFEHTKATFSVKGMASRVGGRISDGAKDVVEVAKAQADDKPGVIAVLVGAIVLWLGREPLLEALGLVDPDETEDGEAYAAPEGDEAPATSPQTPPESRRHS